MVNAEWNLARSIIDYLHGAGFNYTTRMLRDGDDCTIELGRAERVNINTGKVERRAVYAPSTMPNISQGKDTWDDFLGQLSLYTDAFMTGSSRLFEGLGDPGHDQTDSIDAIYFFYRQGGYESDALGQGLGKWKVSKVREMTEKFPLFSDMIGEDLDAIASKVRIVPLSEPARPNIRQRWGRLASLLRPR